MKHTFISCRFKVVLAVLFFITPTQNAGAQIPFSQQAELQATNAVGTASQGASVALSAGDTHTIAIVGGPTDSSNRGAVWVYTFSNGGWTQGDKLAASDAIGNANLGMSVALSAGGDDSTIAIVGGPGDNGGIGAVWVYGRLNAQRDGQKLIGPGASGNAGQGGSVAISADGHTAIVGGANDNVGKGAAWVYTHANDSSGWQPQGHKLTVSDATASAYVGASVALSADGNTAIVGGYGYNGGIGAAWVYTRSSGIWTQQAKLVGTGAVGNAGQGISVALSADGDTAIVGGFRDNGNAGAAWVYTRSYGIWTQQAKLIGTGAVGNASQGVSVALSADGDTAIVGGLKDNIRVGAAWVYTRSSGIWTQQNKLIGTGAVNAGQGKSVALSANGRTAIIGGWWNQGNIGASWVFSAPPPPPPPPKPIPNTVGVFWQNNSPTPWTGTDWSFGYFKAQCPENQEAIGLSKATGGTPAQALLCGTGANSTGMTETRVCRNVPFSSANNRSGSTAGGDWAPGYYKGQCAVNEYVAGVSQSTGGAFQSIWCCASQVARSQSNASTVGVVGGFNGYEPGSGNDDWDFGYFKAQCGAGRYIAGVSRSMSSGEAYNILCAGRALP